MTKITKATEHAKERAKERIDPSLGRKRNGYFVRAYRDGKTPKYFKGDFHDFLMNKVTDDKTVVKVYDNNIFICKNKKVLTVYPVPEEFVPLKNWLKKQPSIKVKKESYFPDEHKSDEEWRKEALNILLKNVGTLYVQTYFDNLQWCTFVALYRRNLTEEAYAKEVKIPLEYIHNWHNHVEKKIGAFVKRYKWRIKPLFNEDGTVNKAELLKPAIKGKRRFNPGITKEDKKRLNAAYETKMRNKHPEQYKDEFIKFILENKRKKVFKEFFGANELKVLTYVVKNNFTMTKIAKKMNISMYFVRKYKNSIEEKINDNLSTFAVESTFLGITAREQEVEKKGINPMFKCHLKDEIIEEIIRRKDEPYFIAYLGRLRYEVFLDIYEEKLTLGELNKKYKISNKYLKRIQTRAILKVQELLTRNDGPFGENYIKGSIPEGYHIQAEAYVEVQLRAIRRAMTESKKQKEPKVEEVKIKKKDEKNKVKRATRTRFDNREQVEINGIVIYREVK